MTKDEFSRRYRVVGQVTSGEVASCRAIDSGGNLVMLHMFGDANRTSEAVASMLADLPPAESAMVHEVIEVEGSAVAVTADIAPFTSFDAWIAASCDQQAAPPAVEPGPAAANQPGAYTMIFQGLDPSSAPPPPSPDQPATQSAASAEEGTDAGDYARLFPAFDPGQPPGPNAAPLSSENEPPGVHARIMQAADLEARPGQPAAASPGPGGPNIPSAAPSPPPPSMPGAEKAEGGPEDTPGVYTRIMQAADLEARPGQPAAPSPPPPSMPGAENAEGGPEDLLLRPVDPAPGPPPVKPLEDPAALAAPGSDAPDYLDRLRTPASPRAPSMPGAHSLEAGPEDLRSRPPDPAPGPPPVKPPEDPAALAAPGGMISNAPDYLDRLRTPISPASPGAQPPGEPPGQVAPEPPPAGPSAGPPPPNPEMAGPSDYTMVVKGFTPPAASGPAAPAPQPPPVAPPPQQPVPARRKSRVPLVIGVIVVVAILVALVVFVVLSGVGGAAGTG